MSFSTRTKRCRWHRNVCIDKNKIGEYGIVQARAADRERILHFLRLYFYTEEPLNVAMGGPPSAADEEDTLALLEHGLSYLVVGCDGTLLGVVLSGPVRPDEADHMEALAASCGCAKFSKLLRFLAAVERRADVWRLSGATRALSVQALAVLPAARGRGFGLSLLQRTRAAAQAAGYPLFRLDCSSCYSAQLAERLGMQCVHSLPYTQYTDVDGHPVFDIPSPHLEMRTYIQSIECSGPLWSLER
ncbi:arylalkylamine N-acetyltransferase-like 2 isoform X2 [Periplaneta americana]|uniref:arylalkylamine N-acetyltransferase-like 2 isoform X2 n=1 Tax=Periplaneta americana TaxID=6978 RepID=UPI0037E74D42